MIAGVTGGVPGGPWGVLGVPWGAHRGHWGVLGRILGVPRGLLGSLGGPFWSSWANAKSLKSRRFLFICLQYRGSWGTRGPMERALWSQWTPEGSQGILGEVLGWLLGCLRGPLGDPCDHKAPSLGSQERQSPLLCPPVSAILRKSNKYRRFFNDFELAQQLRKGPLRPPKRPLGNPRISPRTPQ